MELKIKLPNHCIQTEIKRRYNDDINRYFKQKEANWELENEIECLRILLENIDFALLRRQYVELEGGTESEIKVACRDEETKVSLEICIDNKIVFKGTVNQESARPE